MTYFRAHPILSLSWIMLWIACHHCRCFATSWFQYWLHEACVCGWPTFSLTLECVAEDDGIQYLTPLDDPNQPLLPPASFRVSGESTNHVASDLKSTLMNAKVMARYLLTNKKLRIYLKLKKTLVEHQWQLRSTDRNFVGLVKMYCMECRKEFGSTTRDRSKDTIHNFFANF